MEPSRADHPKGLLITMWIITALSFLILAPVAFIGAIFSSDNSSGATSAMSYAFLLAPFVLLVLPVIAQVMYRRSKYYASKMCAIAALVLCFAALGYLVSVFTR